MKFISLVFYNGVIPINLIGFEIDADNAVIHSVPLNNRPRVYFFCHRRRLFSSPKRPASYSVPTDDSFSR